jgi:hypothetical protein
MTGSARVAERPGHACCPSAVELLRTRSYAGSWQWVVKLERFRASIIYCPWCGVQLPVKAEVVPLLALFKSQN